MTRPPQDRPHRRRNPLTGDWVLVSPHRNRRPWQGAVEATEPGPSIAYDETCYLCPGNERMGGATNPDYQGPYVFKNDFPALMPASETSRQKDGIYEWEGVNGTGEVLCYSPDHSLTMAQMSLGEISAVIDLWCDAGTRLSQEFASVMIFENRGAMMGCSNPHPHGQIWASTHVPNEQARVDARQLAFFEQNRSTLLSAVIRQELEFGERLVSCNDEWIAWVPFWASWPFEVLIAPRRDLSRLWESDRSSRNGLAKVLQEVLVRYDNLFKTSFPFSFGWHNAPGTEARPDWVCHGHFYPPLLRSAEVRKFMVGYEMLGEAQRDLTPEDAAARLRELSPVHYLEPSAAGGVT